MKNENSTDKKTISLDEGDVITDFYDIDNGATDDEEPDFEEEIQIIKK